MFALRMLLSINPKHVENILLGTKKYEFRKVESKRPVEKIVIYSTAPVGMVVGEAEVLGTLDGTPEEVWAHTHRHSGITKEFFDSYYEGRNRAIAYELGEVETYERPKRLIDFGVMCAPQSFVYLAS